jgi:hypothetical protein
MPVVSGLVVLLMASAGAAIIAGADGTHLAWALWWRRGLGLQILLQASAHMIVTCAARQCGQ